MKHTLLLLSLLLPSLLIAQVYPQHKPDKKLSELNTEELNQLFDEANFTYKTQAVRAHADTICKKLNGTMLIAQNDEVLVHKASGYEVLDNQSQPIVENTCFELASVSKAFTAAAVLLLVQEGKVSLIDYLGKYFPNLPYTGITVHNLLCHTSGLPEYFDFKSSWFPQGRLTTNQDVVDVLVKHHPKTIFAPGTGYKYTSHC